MSNVRIEDPLAPTCPVRNVLSRLCDKWSILILLTLEEKGAPERYTAIKARLDKVSPRMLSLTLDNLEADGLIERKQYPAVPPHVEYNLTELGSNFAVYLRTLFNWAEEKMPTIKQNRLKYEEKKKLPMTFYNGLTSMNMPPKEKKKKPAKQKKS